MRRRFQTGVGFVVIGIALLLMPQLQLQAAQLTADEIMAKAVARSERHDPHACDRCYSYTKMSVTQELDSAGKVKVEKKKVWEVSIQAGRASAKLVQVNGKAPPASELKKQAQAENNARGIMGEGKDSNLENRDNLLTPEIAAHFIFELVGTTNIAGRTSYELKFHPRTPSPPIHHMVDRLLNQLSGTLWVDAQEFELARASLCLSSQVDFWGGLIGCLRNFDYTFTRVRMADGLWLKTIASGDFSGRKLVESMRIRTKSEVTNLKFQKT